MTSIKKITNKAYVIMDKNKTVIACNTKISKYIFTKVSEANSRHVLTFRTKEIAKYNLRMHHFSCDNIPGTNYSYDFITVPVRITLEELPED